MQPTPHTATPIRLRHKGFGRSVRVMPMASPADKYEIAGKDYLTVPQAAHYLAKAAEFG